MKRIICASLSLLMLLTGCTAPAPDPLPTESFTYGIYEFTFSVEQLSGEPTDAWDFVYTYNGETITTGHQIRFSLGIFTFHSIQVDIVEKAAPPITSWQIDGEIMETVTDFIFLGSKITAVGDCNHEI